jgi:predicted permease
MVKQLRAWSSRLIGLFNRSHRDQDLSHEIEGHLQMHIDDNIQRGMGPAEARRSALLKLGGIDATKESYRDRRGIPVLEIFVKDVRFGLRLLSKTPAYTAIAVVTLALGIGASTGIFALVNAFLLRQLPVRRPDQIAKISIARADDQSDDLSFPIFDEIQRRQTAFSNLFAWWGDGVFNVQTGGELSRGDIWAVTGNFYSELGARPLLGRLLDDSDVNLRQGAPANVAVVGYGFWQRHYGGDTGVLGKTVLVEGNPFTVIGVTAKGFTALGIANEPDVTVPLTAEPMIADDGPIEQMYTGHGSWLSVGGRLKDGVTLAQAQAQIDSIWPGVLEATLSPKFSAERRSAYLASRVQVTSLATGGDGWLRRRFTTPTIALMIIAGLILLIACVNLANLMLARTAYRGHEISVRLALGASRWRIASQLLTESLMLSTAGAAIGLVIAYEGSKWLRNSIMQSFIVPTALDVTPDARVLTFAAAVAILTAIGFGLAPVVRAMREGPMGSLGRNTRTSAGGTARIEPSLIVTQVALSFVLLTGTGLFVRSFQQLRSMNPGFRIRDEMDIGLFPTPAGYKNLDDDNYYPEMLRRISVVPGVRGASMIHSLPLNNMSMTEAVAPLEKSQGTGIVDTDVQMVAPGLFDTLGVQLLQGRDFTWQDNKKAARVAIVGKRLAGEMFPSGDALGRHIRIGDENERRDIEIVGVVGDASMWNLRKQNSAEVYIPMLQGWAEWSELILWTSGSPEAVLSGVRHELESMGHEYAYQVIPLSTQVDRSILEEYLTATLSAFFGGLALCLAGIGLYGLVSYSVTRKTREIGIRMALGAERGRVMKMLLRETLTIVLAGIAVGIPCALAAGKLISHMLFGMSPYDPSTLAIVALALLATAGLACYLPVRRAMRVEPTTALRYE